MTPPETDRVEPGGAVELVAEHDGAVCGYAEWWSHVHDHVSPSFTLLLDRLFYPHPCLPRAASFGPHVFKELFVFPSECRSYVRNLRSLSVPDCFP